MRSVKHMVVGLQSSGKTTFAAAMWYLVDSGEVRTKLKRGKHNGDFTYLESLAANWAAGWQVPRTSSEQIEHIKLNLLEEKTDVQVSVSFPDLPGEAFERAFATRQLSKRIVTPLEDIDGLIVFVTTDRVRDDISILDLAIAPGAVPLEGEVGEEEEEITFSPKDTPQQVQLVDLLQCFQKSPLWAKPKRIAVIISAWDLAPAHNDPDRWLNENMPLLSQYLLSLSIPSRVYGVSAQGGRLPLRNDLEKESDRDHLLKVAKASERIIIKGHGADDHDLTHPIHWLSGLPGL